MGRVWIVEKIAVERFLCNFCDRWVRKGEKFFAPLCQSGPRNCEECHRLGLGRPHA